MIKKNLKLNITIHLHKKKIMIPKTTLSRLNDFFLNLIQKFILYLPAFFEKKVWVLLFEISNTSKSILNSSKTFTKSFLSQYQTNKVEKLKVYLKLHFLHSNLLTLKY